MDEADVAEAPDGGPFRTYSPNKEDRVGSGNHLPEPLPHSKMPPGSMELL